MKKQRSLAIRLFWGFLVVLILALLAFVSAETDAFVASLGGVHVGPVVFAVLLAILVAVQIARRAAHFTPLGRRIIRVGGRIGAFVFYFILALAIARLLALALPDHPQALYLAALFAALAATGIGILRAQTELVTVHYDLTLCADGAPYKLVLASDLHLGSCVDIRALGRIARAINAENPDMVILAGDIFNDGRVDECEDPDAFADIFRALHAPDGIFAVVGNHDPLATDALMRDFFERAGITLLFNDIYQHPRFDLLGRNDLFHIALPRPAVREIHREDPARPLIVIDHNPAGIPEAVGAGADLVLCGHTHRGQFFPLNLFTRLASPKDGFYGHATIGQTHIVVSAGAGYFWMPLRLGSSNEIVSITLRV